MQFFSGQFSFDWTPPVTLSLWLSVHQHVQYFFLIFLPKQLCYLILTGFLCTCLHVTFTCNKKINNSYRSSWASYFPCLLHISLSLSYCLLLYHVSKQPQDKKRPWINKMFWIIMVQMLGNAIVESIDSFERCPFIQYLIRFFYDGEASDSVFVCSYFFPTNVTRLACLSLFCSYPLK